MTIKRLSCAFALTAAVFLSPLQASAQDVIKLGVLPFSESLAAIIADKEGFFEDEGLKVEITKFDSGAVAVPVLQSGSIDVVLSNTVATLQAIEHGLDAVILAPGAIVRSSAPDTTTALLVRKGTIGDLKELEGKQVAVNVINSSAWLHMVATLEKYGVDYTKVQFAEVPFPQMNAPLFAGQLAAIGQVDPFRSAAMATGDAEIKAWTYVETAPNTQITQYIALAPWVEEHPETAAKFVRALIKGAEFAVSDEARAREINMEFTNLNPDLKDKVLLPLLGTENNLENLNETKAMMSKYGLLETDVDLSDRVFQP